MTKYIIQCIKATRHSDYDGQKKGDELPINAPFQVPHPVYPNEYDHATLPWLNSKPNKGVDLNTAYRRLEYLQTYHMDCKCIHEVVEV